MRDMGSLNRYLLAVCIWAVFVIGSYVVSVQSTPRHVWDSYALLPLAGVPVLGLIVVGFVALLCRPLGKIAGAIVGFVCGLLPSVLIILSLYVVGAGFEASLEGSGVAVMLAGPSALGGAVAGIICSGQKKVSLTASVNKTVAEKPFAADES